jgi:hypothetical protein
MILVAANTRDSHGGGEELLSEESEKEKKEYKWGWQQKLGYVES